MEWRIFVSVRWSSGMRRDDMNAGAEKGASHQVTARLQPSTGQKGELGSCGRKRYTDWLVENIVLDDLMSSGKPSGCSDTSHRLSVCE